ncbi:DDB1- and CUL4-associated factor 7 [Toxocara canis]|uniref:DDB1-and CUL4-associated factor 7 n=1 Tax=Toxocara canis TaxID=6265 RepID=A0A0B2VN38_TOXCA|nr:DDB1- and CUL4-associated factor 7 [Toxocara canis]
MLHELGRLMSASVSTSTQLPLSQQHMASNQMPVSSVPSTINNVVPTNTGIARPPVPSSIESVPPPTPTVAPPAPAPPKRREIYRFTSNRPLFAAAWSCKRHPDKRWRIAVGSVVEDKPQNNRVSVVQLDEQQGELVERFSFEHNFPPNCIEWIPDLNDNYPDILATSGECLKIYRVDGNTATIECILNNKQTSNYSGPLTNFDWNDVDPSLIGTSSIDMSCTIWQLETGQTLGQTKKTSGSVKTQLIAHDKPVHDIAFSKIGNGRDNFATVGADGSARLFDLRNLQHSTIVYEDPMRTPLMRLAWNKQDSHYLATFAQDSAEVVVIDIRMPCSPVARLHNHRACVNGLAWAPHSACHICTAGDDHQALIWDVSSMPRPVEDPILAYQAAGEVNQVHWSAAHTDWICICFGKCLEILRV